MISPEEKQKKIKAAFYTVGINIVIFLLLFFAAAWRTAGYGEGEYAGIEVNLGYDDEGSGNIQPDEPVGTEKATDDENPPSKKTEVPKEEPPAREQSEQAESPKEVQTKTVTDPNSDVVIREDKKEIKPAEKAEEKKPVETVEKPVEKKVEQPKIDQKAVYKGKTTTTDPATSGGEGEGKQGASGSEGDDTGKTGDKGVEGGIEGAAVYKGTPGGGDGGTLIINGWDWDKIEKPNVPGNETGRVVFEIEVDENGDLRKIRKVSGIVSPAAESACRAAIQKITFTKKPNATVPPVTKGTITFVIRSQ